MGKERVMFDYPTYYDEWNGPEAGIDTISIWIHPYLINKHSDFHKQGNGNKAINLRKKIERNPITKKIYRTDYIMEVQAEAINQDFNILHQIFCLIIKLFQSGILTLRNMPDENMLYNFLSCNFNTLFSLDYMDFFFDIKEDNAKLLGQINPRYPNTQYSSDNSMKTYNRIPKLKQKNTIQHTKIDGMAYPRRIEFHLTRSTCRYLSITNLDGNFDIVFQKYLHFFSRKWLKYKRQLIDIPNDKISDYYYLSQIDNLAFSSHTIPHNKALDKSPLKPIPYKKAKKNEADSNWLPGFVTGKSMPKI